jgi:hypothetical protein
MALLQTPCLLNLYLYSLLYNLPCIRTDPHPSDSANSLTIQRPMTEPHGLSLAQTAGIAEKDPRCRKGGKLTRLLRTRYRN